MSRFSGILPPLTTPFSAHGEVLLDTLERNIVRYQAHSVSGFVLLGSTGEAIHLSPEERVGLLERICPQLPADCHRVVGVSFPTLRHTLAFLGQIRHLPVDAILLSTPHYYKNRMHAEALADYFVSVADQSPFPLLLYNFPQFTGLELEAGLVGRLARHQNIVGIKDSSGNLVYLQKILVATAGLEFEVLSGSAETFTAALTLGVEGFIYAIACVVPELVAAVQEEFQVTGGQSPPSQRSLFRVCSTVVGKFGVPGIKYAMDLRELEGASCRAPLLPLADSEKAEIEKLLAEVAPEPIDAR